jgi:hypothetical protein
MGLPSSRRSGGSVKPISLRGLKRFPSHCAVRPVVNLGSPSGPPWRQIDAGLRIDSHPAGFFYTTRLLVIYRWRGRGWLLRMRRLRLLACRVPRLLWGGA